MADDPEIKWKELMHSIESDDCAARFGTVGEVSWFYQAVYSSEKYRNLMQFIEETPNGSQYVLRRIKEIAKINFDSQCENTCNEKEPVAHENPFDIALAVYLLCLGTDYKLYKEAGREALEVANQIPYLLWARSVIGSMLRYYEFFR